MSSINHQKNKLLSDLQQVIQDAEHLLKSSEHSASDQIHSAKEKIEAALRHTKSELEQLEESVVTKGKEVADSADTYVKKHPWQSVGIAAGVGVLIGLLIARK